MWYEIFLAFVTLITLIFNGILSLIYINVMNQIIKTHPINNNMFLAKFTKCLANISSVCLLLTSFTIIFLSPLIIFYMYIFCGSHMLIYLIYIR
jgi:hypothetical protein